MVNESCGCEQDEKLRTTERKDENKDERDCCTARGNYSCNYIEEAVLMLKNAER